MKELEAKQFLKQKYSEDIYMTPNIKANLHSTKPLKDMKHKDWEKLNKERQFMFDLSDEIMGRIK